MEEDIKKLLEQNLAATEQVRVIVAKVERHLFWQRVTSLVYMIIIVAPIIFAAIYLPPIIRPYLDEYQRLFQDLSTSQRGRSADYQSSNLFDLLNEFSSINNQTRP